MKKLFSFLLCFILLFTLCLTVIAENKTNLILEYNGNAIKQGSTLRVNFLIDNNSGFGTVSSRIGFNKDNLELKSINKIYKPTGNYVNIHLDSSVNTANKKGEVLVGFTPDVLEKGNFTAPITYNGVLVEFIFTAKNDCLPQIYFISNELYLDDMDLTDIPYNAQIKNVHILENPSSNKTTTSSDVNSGSASNLQNEIITQNPDSSDIGIGVINPNTSEITYDTTDNIKQPQNNNLLILGIVIGVAMVIVAAAFLVKKLRKK